MTSTSTPLSRRSFLKGAARGAAGTALSPTILMASPLPGMAPRPDLLDADSPKGLEVYQLTRGADLSGAHLYMEAQIFTRDSKRFLLHRSATAHGGSRSDPRHQYFVCDLENRGALSPIVTELGGVAPSVTPDGTCVYYLVDETVPGGGRLTLKRVKLDGTGRETLLVLDSPLPGTKFRASRPYSLSTISSDGRRLAVSCFLGDGNAVPPPYGLLVFDLEKATASLILHGPTWCNMHSQYCRSTDPRAAHDILIQENHGCEVDARGSLTKLTGGAGADIHVIRDDGSDFRTMPWGRDGNEACQGHQCWRGQGTWAITSTGTRAPRGAFLIEGQARPDAGHLGNRTPGGIRNDLTRNFPEARFSHFGVDLAGTRLISDAGPWDKGGRIYAAEFGEPGNDPLRNWTYLMSPRSSCKKEAHIHPFLSPDGKLGFFNSDESGTLHAYLVKGFA